ncbi:MAG TPA: hypothetical protein VKR79_00800 [Gaiellaceae bacterium]|nr:hypothetical protein [Gaiellaceae bacterium]
MSGDVTGDPVAWRAIEQGWKVLAADGTAVGYVDQVTGDLNGDIFDGITVGDGGTVLTRARYVPAEQVATIRVGEVVLALGADDMASLEPYVEPVSKPLASLIPEQEPGARGRPGPGSPLGRLFSVFRGRR